MLTPGDTTIASKDKIRLFVNFSILFIFFNKFVYFVGNFKLFTTFFVIIIHKTLGIFFNQKDTCPNTTFRHTVNQNIFDKKIYHIVTYYFINTNMLNQSQ